MALKDIGVRAVVENLGQYNRGMDQINRRISQSSKFIQANAAAFRKAGLAVTAFGAAITGVGAVTVKMAATFDAKFREVNSLLNLSEENLDALREQTLALAQALGVDAIQATEALYQVISAGVPRGSAIDFLEIASKAAIAGVTETQVAVDGLTTVINAFGKDISEAQRVADIMFVAVKGGKTTFEELSASMFQAAPLAAVMGVRFEEVAAAAATLTKSGFPTKVAMTSLRQALVALQKPTEDMKVLLSELGFSSGEALIASEGLQGALVKLTRDTSASSEEIAKAFGSVEALGAVLGLTGDKAEIAAADLAASFEAAGAATEAFDIINASASRQLTIMTSRLKVLAINIGTELLPVVVDIAQKIAAVVSAVTDWAAAHPGLTRVIVIATAAVGALALVLGPLLIILPSLVAGLTALKVALIGLGSVGLGPIGLIISAASLLAVTVLPKLIGQFNQTTRASDAMASSLNRSAFALRGVVDVPFGELFGLSEQAAIVTLEDRLNALMALRQRLLEMALGPAPQGLGFASQALGAGDIGIAKKRLEEVDIAIKDVLDKLDELRQTPVSIGDGAVDTSAVDKADKAAEALRQLTINTQLRITGAIAQGQRERERLTAETLEKQAEAAQVAAEEEAAIVKVFDDRRLFFQDLNAKTARDKAANDGRKVLADLKQRNEERELFERRTAETIQQINTEAAMADAALRATQIMETETAQRAITDSWDRLRFDLNDLVVGFRQSGFSLQEILQGWADSTGRSIDEIIDGLQSWGIAWDDTLGILQAAEPQMDIIIGLLEDQAKAAQKVKDATEANIRAQEKLARIQAGAQAGEFGPGGAGRLAPQLVSIERVFAALLSNIALAEANLLTVLPKPLASDFAAAVAAFFQAGATAGDAVLSALKQFSQAFIPEFAHGGTMMRSGPAIVGERGPEIVMLPVGASVAPAVSRTTNFNVDAHYGDTQQPASIAQDLEALTMLAGT